MKTGYIGFLVLAVLLTALACAPAVNQANPSPTTAGSAGAGPVSAAPGGWEQDWEKLKAEGRKEGTVVLAGNIGPTSREVLTKELNDRFGIQPEFMAARGSEISLKIITEQNAGLYEVDIIFSTTSDVLTKLMPQGRLEAIDTALILPEAKDPKAWYQGEVPWLDKAKKYHLGFFAVAKSGVLINTQMTNAKDLQTYKVLLDPKWKGKILINDPTLGGAGIAWFTAVASDIGLDYFNKLLEQEPVILRDQRLMTEWVARGRYPVLLGFDEQSVTEFVKAGAPITPITLAEGAYTTQSNGAVSISLKPPHPNAAKVVLNWVMTKEGGRLLSEAQLCQSARADIAPDYLPSYMQRQPGIKYTNTSTEDYQWKKAEYQDIAEKVFGPYIKK